MPTLTKYDVALIGVKLLAIYFIVSALNTLPGWLLAFTGLFGQGSSRNVYQSGFHYFYLSWPLIMLAMPMLLWIFADKIARFITQTNGDAIAAANNSRKHLQETLICIAGIIIFMLTIPNLLLWLFTVIQVHMQAPGSTQPLWPIVSKGIALLLKMFLSVILIFKAHTLSRWIKQLRYAGIK